MNKLDEIFNGDKYISFNSYTDFCRKNNFEIDEELLNEKNNEFIEKKLIEYKEYFDHMFTDVGENIMLDEEQRKIVLRDDDYSLINAGAGSGKSTTMAAKVKYLIDKLNIKPDEIIMLTFTKKSSEDLDEKVNDLLDLGIPVSTFHSLGMKFIKKFYPYPIQVVGEEEQKKIICNYIKTLFKDKEKLKELIELFKQYENKMFIAKGFIENYEKFDTFEEYFEDYKKRKYLIENSKPGGIHQYLKNRLSLRNSLYTIRGEKVKSIGEVRIANFLYANSIDYSYEKVFEEKVNEDTSYVPDFTLEYQGKNIYIEYFGLSNRNIELKRRSDEEIFNRVLDNNLNAEFYNFVDLIIKFIDIFKNMLIDDEEYMFEKRIRQINEENFKYYCYHADMKKEAECRTKAIKHLKEIYEYYQIYLMDNHMIDYSDMINLSYKQIIKEVKNKYPELNYKYIIVDEYQDITFQRFLFVKRLTEYFNAKLISVGDDWQSIYAFAGSRLELFNKFTEMFINSKDDMYLSTTYRYGQELVNLTSEFILQNKEQSNKHIKSIKHLEHPIEICQYIGDEEYEKIYEIVHKLYSENPKSNILILARTNECLYKLGKSDFFTKGINDVMICNDLHEAKIEALTMHRSKGLTADQVIVFGLRKKVFPSRGRVSHWIFEYFKLDSVNEQMPFAEERRLFYVALTRTRNKVYLVVPDARTNKSEFVNEIEKMMENSFK